jgi:hypothetical protein
MEIPNSFDLKSRIPNSCHQNLENADSEIPVQGPMPGLRWCLIVQLLAAVSVLLRYIHSFCLDLVVGPRSSSQEQVCAGTSLEVVKPKQFKC